MEVENVATSGADTAAPVATDAVVSQAEPSFDNIDSDLRAVWDKSHAPRDESGKFASPDAPTGDKPAENPATPEQKPATTREMPASWKSRQFETHWQTLSPDAQDAILAREQEMTAGVQKLQERFKPLEPIQNVINQHAERLQSNGLDPATAIQRLFEAERRLATDPVNSIIWLAKSYGVDPSKLALASQGQPTTNSDPLVQSLVAELNQVKALVQQQQSQTVQQQEAAMMAEIDAFKKNAEHFEDLRDDMAKLLTAGVASTLQEAYQLAQLSNQTVRDKVLAAEVEKRIAAQREEAAKAAKAGKVNVKGGPASGAASQTIDDTLSAIARKAYAS